MHRIDTPTAQKDKFGQGKNGFTNGDPTTGTPSTGLDEAMFDALQEEVCTVVERSGIKLNKDQHDQLYQAIRKLSKEDLSKALLKAQNLADLPDKGIARNNLEVYSQSQTDSKYLPKTGGTVTGALHVTHSVNVGDVDSGLIANGDGNVAFYANNVKTGEWNNDRLHWIKNIEIGGALNVSGDANFIKNINTKANINAWDLKANGGVYDQGQRVYSSRNPPTSANLSQNGWYKDNTTGFIYQWGYIGSTNVTQNFPLAFPRSCFSIIVSNANAQGKFLDVAFGYPVNNASFYVATKDVEGHITNYPVYWFAVGF